MDVRFSFVFPVLLISNLFIILKKQLILHLLRLIIWNLVDGLFCSFSWLQRDTLELLWNLLTKILLQVIRSTYILT